MPFLRIQQIIWDQLLAFEADLTKVKLFLFLCQKPCGVYYACYALFYSLPFCSSPCAFFSSTSVNKSLKKIFPFKIKLSGNNSGGRPL